MMVGARVFWLTLVMAPVWAEAWPPVACPPAAWLVFWFALDAALLLAFSLALALVTSFSHEKCSAFNRSCSPCGPNSHVRWPFVNAVQLSALRHTSSPPVVGCSAFPFVWLNASLARHSPTTSGIRLRTAANPNWN